MTWCDEIWRRLTTIWVCYLKLEQGPHLSGLGCSALLCSALLYSCSRLLSLFPTDETQGQDKRSSQVCCPNVSRAVSAHMVYNVIQDESIYVDCEEVALLIDVLQLALPFHAAQ